MGQATRPPSRKRNCSPTPRHRADPATRTTSSRPPPLNAAPMGNKNCTAPPHNILAVKKDMTTGLARSHHHHARKHSHPPSNLRRLQPEPQHSNNERYACQAWDDPTPKPTAIDMAVRGHGQACKPGLVHSIRDDPHQRMHSNQ